MQNDFEKDVGIDPNALDVEWLRQPGLVAKYTRLNAEARDNVTRAKDQMEVVKAQVDGELRSGFAAGEKKPTEAAIASMVLQHEKCIGANEEYLKAKLNADLVQAACTALDHKKAALENLVRLYGQQYFAGPREPRDLSLEWSRQAQDKAEDSVDDRARTALGRRNPETESEQPARRRC